MSKIHRAVVSVYDKTGIVEFASKLSQLQVEIISTGGTADHLREHGVEVIPISEITGFPEILDGRVKTLHPNIYGGLLSLRDNADHMAETREHGIGLIDLIVVNLYPFEQVIARGDATTQEALENIDIGGPCMIRAAAKNYPDVAVVTCPDQYDSFLAEIDKHAGETTLKFRKQLAGAAFALTASYDAAINSHLTESTEATPFPARLNFNLEKVSDLRYGENPHQQAALYRDSREATGLLQAKQLHGKELSHNNYLDANAALQIVQGFDEAAVAIVKHSNPCGVAIGGTLAQAYANARATDPVSSFGGIVGINRTVDVEAAQLISEVFTEVVVAPGFEPDALTQLKSKKNLRLLALPKMAVSRGSARQLTCVEGGFLLQDQDSIGISDINFRVVSARQPDDHELQALRFAWQVCKWVKSNAIVYCKATRTVGIGAGQMSRVDSARLAAEKAVQAGLGLEGSVLASDAFFPFRDGVDIAAEAGATALIQPGGSIRDQEVIAAANDHNMAMVFTGIRHFRH